ncbi:response regulator transcription factor [Aliifodinibius sp. S!AR15-10]|uniref:response regulator transcription factor n=1 Tax=Aliifodinibius sp. S!AR15-10 TaxID=2950437 RepID=UPI00285BAC86|nr:response regulator transcription factor [Aliifodinibius sp. S!AR15-10]MDR8389618.1 response regulator transcription factor [Aliifodinibius sp. S!AR15-10]
MQKKNILVANFHKIFRDGIISMLEATEEFNVLEAASQKKVIELCKKETVDIIILDNKSSVIKSIPLISKITSDFPSTRVLTLLTNIDRANIRQLRQEGASGYLLKKSGREELLQAVNTLLDGSTYVCDEITLSVMRNLDGNSSPPETQQETHSLTDRELEVLALIVNEYTNPEIAEKLSISVRTVDAHRRNLLQKTGVRNTAGLVRHALNKNLLD